MSSFRPSFNGLLMILFASSAFAAGGVKPNPSIFIRYQFEVSEIISLLESSQGRALDPQSIPALWLDEMGWRKWVKEYSRKPLQLTQEMRELLLAQEKFLKSSFSYEPGDIVWTPAERGEEPYGHSQAKVNPRGKIMKIIRGEKETYFVVEVGVDNGAQGGTHSVPGTYYDGSSGPVLDYGPGFNIEKKNYIYSLAEIERYNAPFRSQHVGADTGVEVDYTRDAKWLAKLDAFKEKVARNGLEINFKDSPEKIYESQRNLIIEMFRHFKMNRNAPSGHPLLGDLASGGGACYQQACVLSHGVHAVGEPWGIRAMNIDGATINPSGGHGFTRLTVRGPDEVHVYDMAIDQASGAVKFKGIEIKSNTINYISDPGWADFGTTPDTFAMTPIEEAINPKPVDANRAIHDLIQGKSFEEVVMKYGGKGPMVANTDLKSEWFSGSKSIEFLAPTGQIFEAKTLERDFPGELGAMVKEAKELKSSVMAEPTGSARWLKSRILLEVVEPKIGKINFGGFGQDSLRILLTEYLFRSVK